MIDNNEKWEDFVNDFLFANFERLEYWIAKREVGENGKILNYIQFPKAENGRILTIEFVKYIVQSIEADDSLCEKIFGPAYEKGSADIQDDAIDITIIWNQFEYESVMNEKAFYNELYRWSL